MTIPNKKQAFLLATAVVCLLLVSIVIVQFARRANVPASTVSSRNFAPDSAREAFAPESVARADSMLTTLAPDSIAPPREALVISSLDRVATAQSALAPALNDTVLRYGSHATRMQMLIELLEEKQMLMEEKFELSRRLEVAEILDSALVVTAKPELSASAMADSLNFTRSSTLDSLFSNQRDSIEQTILIHPDSLQPASFIPPQK